MSTERIFYMNLGLLLIQAKPKAPFANGCKRGLRFFFALYLSPQG